MPLVTQPTEALQDSKLSVEQIHQAACRRKTDSVYEYFSERASAADLDLLFRILLLWEANYDRSNPSSGNVFVKAIAVELGFEEEMGGS